MINLMALPQNPPPRQEFAQKDSDAYEVARSTNLVAIYPHITTLTLKLAVLVINYNATSLEPCLR